MLPLLEAEAVRRGKDSSVIATGKPLTSVLAAEEAIEWLTSDVCDETPSTPVLLALNGVIYDGRIPGDNRPWFTEEEKLGWIRQQLFFHGARAEFGHWVTREERG